MKKYLALLAALAVMAPLAACIDGVADAINTAAGNGTQSILDQIDEGMDEGKATAQGKIDDYVAGLNAPSGGGGGGGSSLLPIGSACSVDTQCQSNNCIVASGDSTRTCQP